MYLGYRDSLDWLELLRHEVDTRPALMAGRVVPFVIPSFPVLPAAASLIAGSGLLLGAQNCGWADGAWTGEVSPSMLAELGVRLVEIGHAERRAHFGENDDVVALKVRAADDAGLTPLLCVGERRPVRPRPPLLVYRQIEAAVGATGGSRRGSSSPTNRCGPSALPSPPAPRTCPTSSGTSAPTLPITGSWSCPLFTAVRPSRGCCPGSTASPGCSWAASPTTPRTSAEVLDEALLLAEGTPATDAAPVQLPPTTPSGTRIPLQDSPGSHSHRWTCPSAATNSGQNAILPTVGAQEWACPLDWDSKNEHVLCAEAGCPQRQRMGMLSAPGRTGPRDGHARGAVK